MFSSSVWVAGSESSAALTVCRQNGAIEDSDPATQAAAHKNPSPGLSALLGVGTGDRKGEHAI